jgi:flagellar biosynthesis/type III secretory pathway chaperone
MIPLIEQLITALREELTHYGEMLARLDHQQDLVVRRQPDEILQSVGSIQAQAAALRTARDQRERCRQELLSRLGLDAEAPAAKWLPSLPASHRGLVQALVQENNELLGRLHQRTRQNHLLLSRSVELMQGLIGTLFPALDTPTYNDRGAVPAMARSARAVFEGVG